MNSLGLGVVSDARHPPFDELRDRQVILVNRRVTLQQRSSMLDVVVLQRLEVEVEQSVIRPIDQVPIGLRAGLLQGEVGWSVPPLLNSRRCVRRQ